MKDATFLAVDKLKYKVLKLAELTAQEQANQCVDPQTDKVMREINKLYKLIIDESKEQSKTIKDLLGVIKEYERECV
jgi:uncharacterized protein YecT (DUF1311 family)